MPGTSSSSSTTAPPASILAANDGQDSSSAQSTTGGSWERAVEAAKVDHGVALAGEAVVELDHHRADGRGRPLAQAPRRRLDRVDRAQVLGPVQHRHAGQPGDPPRPGLGAEAGQGGRRPVQGQPEPLGQLLLAGGDVEGLHERPARALAQLPDPVQQLRPVEQLGRERPGGGVAGGQHVQPRPRSCRVGQEAEVVVDHRLFDRHRGQVDDLDPGPAQQQQQEQQPFLVVADADDLAQLGRQGKLRRADAPPCLPRGRAGRSPGTGRRRCAAAPRREPSGGQTT